MTRTATMPVLLMRLETVSEIMVLEASSFKNPMVEDAKT
jgi:hypothetical protein